LNGAIEQGYEVNRARLVRGVKQLVTNNDTESSEEDLLAILKSDSATAFELIPALQFLRDISADWKAAVGIAIDRPDEQYKTILSVISYLMAWEEALPHCANRLLALTEFDGLTALSRRRTHNYTGLCLIASGKFHQALTYIEKSLETDGGKPQAQHLFNRAMATWGINQAPPEDLLQEFLACQEMRSPDNSVNTRQCLALSHGALGHRDEAMKQLRLAEHLLTPGDTSFSCWSYLNSSSEELTEHFEEMQNALENKKPLTPRFISRTAEAGQMLH
jgi:tetratricopeptide (TPR) repeat protein